VIAREAGRQAPTWNCTRTKARALGMVLLEWRTLTPAATASAPASTKRSTTQARPGIPACLPACRSCERSSSPHCRRAPKTANAPQLLLALEALSVGAGGPQAAAPKGKCLCCEVMAAKLAGKRVWTGCMYVCVYVYAALERLSSALVQRF